MELEKNRKKAELLTTEYYNLQTESAKSLSESRMKIDELSEKLIGFEGLEAELESAALMGEVSLLFLFLRSLALFCIYFIYFLKHFTFECK